MCKLVRVANYDSSIKNRLNYLFRTKQLTKYYDDDYYVCFNQEEFLLLKKKKRGKKQNEIKI